MWKKIPAVPKLSAADQEAREFQCEGCPSRFFRLSALETHEKLCYKAPVQVKENQAQLIYDLIEKSNAEESRKNEPNEDNENRKSRSRIPKKHEEETKGKRKRESLSNSDKSQKQSKLSKTQQKELEAEISDNEAKSNKENPEPDSPTTEENKLNSGKKTSKFLKPIMRR